MPRRRPTRFCRAKLVEDMSEGTIDQEPEIPVWRQHARAAVEPYQEGFDVLAAALAFASERLAGAALTKGDLAGAGGRAILPILAARAIGTVDSIHALLAVGRVEQADMLVRTLIDLQADAHLLVARSDAVDYYADWATVEQARGALLMKPDEVTRPGRDLDNRRRELAESLVDRLRSIDEEKAATLTDSDLGEILEEFCRSRYGSRRPPSWRSGYLKQKELSVDNLREIINGTAAEAGELSGVPEPQRLLFQSLFERELELLFGHLSGEIHNSPLAIDRHIDSETYAIRIHGDWNGTSRPLLAGFLHLMRVMLLFEHVWITEPAVAEWSARALTISDAVGDP